MLPQKYRLTRTRDFERVIKEGKSFKEGFLVLKKINNDFQRIRIGFVVSQKISKKATIRNKIKRRLREVLQANLSRINSGYDLVFFTRKGIETQDFQEIKASAERILKKAKVLRIVNKKP